MSRTIKPIYVFDLNGKLLKKVNRASDITETSTMGVYQSIRNRTVYQRKWYLSYEKTFVLPKRTIASAVYMFNLDKELVKTTTLQELVNKYNCEASTIYRSIRKSSLFDRQYFLATTKSLK